VFTGIIETNAKLVSKQLEGSNVHFIFSSSIGNELKIDQSVAHNGVCLTVVSLGSNQHKVTAIEETLTKTNLGKLQVGDIVNIERCMPANGRFDGHLVQGHVDDTAICSKVITKDGSWEFYFELNQAEQALLVVDKGSICINGVSLTVVACKENTFHVAIIPYTFEHTQFKFLKAGDTVNLEFDIVGKYLQKHLAFLKVSV
jgi:riboflavin synthase